MGELVPHKTVEVGQWHWYKAGEDDEDADDEDKD